MGKPKDKPVDYSKPLDNAKYERFCQEYMVDSNATQAAIRAKYSEKTAQQQGSRLLLNVVISNRIAVLSHKLSKETGISVKMVAEGFRKIATGVITKQLTNKNKLRAYENLGKHVGFYERDNKQKADALGELLSAIDGRTKGLPDK